MTVLDLLREATARRAALYRLAKAHDEFSEIEQLYAAEGDTAEAERIHRFALLTLRAYTAETDDRESPPHVCPECHDDSAREGWR